MEYYVYHLIDPRSNTPFYVGKGKGQRAYSHLSPIVPVHNLMKTRTIAKIRRDGYEPSVLFVAQTLTEEAAYRLEKEEIKKYGRRGIDRGGILTNMTEGGEGGDTSMFFTKETFRKLREKNAGVNNAAAKLNKEQVLEVFRSTKPVCELAQEFGVSNAQISGIKRKKYYASVTRDITDPPGHCPTTRRKPLTPEMVREIYEFSGTTAELKAKFGVSVTVARHIKVRVTYREDTQGLGEPGEIKTYRLSESDVRKIKQSNESLDVLAARFSVHRETIRNIRKGITRG